MKWFGLLVVGFVSWVLVRAFVPALFLFCLGVAILIAALYRDVFPLLAVAVVGLVYGSHLKGRGRDGS